MIFLAWLIYIPLQLAWLPLTLLGAVWVAYKQVGVSRKLGLSQTAVEVLNGRWTGDRFGLRPDPASRRLAAHLPNNSVLGLSIALFPLWVAKHVAGRPFLYPLLPDDEVCGLASIFLARSRRFDNLIASRADEAQQLVILGAGYDTRCYGDLAAQGLVLFELDQSADQRAKCAALKRAGLRTDHVHYIEVDFSDPQWITALTASAYDPSLKTIFLWEGVTLYLSEADVRATLALLKAHSAPGSVVLLDLYSKGTIALLNKGASGRTLKATGEGLKFGLDFSTDAEEVLTRFASSAHYALGTHYFVGSAAKNGAFMVIAEFETGA